MRGTIEQFFRDRRGQDLAEYGVALAVIGTGAGAVALALAGNLSTVWSNANTVIQNAADLIAGS